MLTNIKNDPRCFKCRGAITNISKFKDKKVIEITNLNTD